MNESTAEDLKLLCSPSVTDFTKLSAPVASLKLMFENTSKIPVITSDNCVPSFMPSAIFSGEAPLSIAAFRLLLNSCIGTNKPPLTATRPSGKLLPFTYLSLSIIDVTWLAVTIIEEVTAFEYLAIASLNAAVFSAILLPSKVLITLSVNA